MFALAALTVDTVAYQVRQDEGLSGLRALNYAFVWLGVHQMGYAWPPPERGLLWAAGGLGFLIFLVTRSYPVSMITVGEAVSNTFALFALGMFQAGLVLALDAPMARTAPAMDSTVLVNGTIMTLFLWHLEWFSSSASPICSAMSVFTFCPDRRVVGVASYLARALHRPLGDPRRVFGRFSRQRERRPRKPSPPGAPSWAPWRCALRSRARAPRYALRDRWLPSRDGDPRARRRRARSRTALGSCAGKLNATFCPHRRQST